MKMRKSAIVTSLIVGSLIVIGAYAVNQADAQGNGFGGGPTAIIQKLAERFNLNQDDVKAVFDEQRTENQKQMQDRQKERLDQLVKDGKINQDQENAIMSKMQEMQQQRGQDAQDFKNLTPEQRKEKMQQRRTEMEQWAKDNGIDLKTLGLGFGGGFRGHGGHGFGDGPCKDNGNND